MEAALPISASRALNYMKNIPSISAILLCAILLPLGACHEKPKAKKGTNVAAVVTYAVAETRKIDYIVKGSGTITPWQEAPVGAEVGGLTAVALLADEGQYVRQGQALLKMNDVLLQAQLRQAEAQAEQAEKAYNRAMDLHKQQFMSDAALDQSAAAHKTAQAFLDTARTQASMATVKAPISGIITTRTAVLGQIVEQGKPLFTIVRDAALELNMELTDKDLAMVKPDQVATVYSETQGEVTGRVRLVTPQINPTTRIGFARVRVPWSSGLRPGMFAKAEILAGTFDAVIVPSRAVVYTENKAAIFVIGNEGRVRLVPVRTGQVLNNETVILEGVAASDKVVTVGAGFLVDGDKVEARAQEITVSAADVSGQKAVDGAK